MSTQIPTRVRRGLVAVLLTLVVGALTVPASPADAAGLSLHKGSRGSAVQTLEVRLAKVAGLPRSQVDRRYRAATVRAVKRFQVARHLRATGTVNQRTWDLVASAYVYATSWHRPAWAAPKVAAHRGGGPEAGIPENTIASFQYGLSRGAGTVEFDLQATSDGHFVLMHDQTLARTTTCETPGDRVANYTLQALQAACKLADGSDIPTFADVAQWAGTNDVTIMPELKDATASLSDAELDELLTTISDDGLGARTILQSFNASTAFPRVSARNAARTTPLPIRFAYLSDDVPAPDAATIKATGASVAALWLNSSLTTAAVDRLRAAGLQVWIWTPRTVAQLHSAWSLHADWVITDTPASAVATYR